MKNLRKLLAVIITVAMMATMFVIPAFAAEPSDADICDTLGMLKGTEGKVDDKYLATTPLRYQAAIMFLRLKGLEAEALAYKGTDNFSDAGEIWADGQKMLAYLKANPELGFEGIGDNKFDPMGEMTAQAYYKVLLVALGYEYGVDFKWDEVFAFAKEIGLSKVADVKAFTVNDLAIATVEAFKANVKGEEFTLIEALVADKVVSEAKAIEAGLIEPEPEVLAVESVSADNLKQIYVEFNGADFNEDDVTDVDNYKVTDKDDKELDLDAADLDGNVITLTLKNGVKNQTKVKVTVKKKILGEDQKFDLELIDTTLPKALSAEVVGVSTVKVIFSEPINTVDKADFEVDGGDYYIKDVKKMKNDTEVNVMLYSSLEEGDLEVKIKTNDIEDYAGFSVLKKTFKLKVEEDKEPPVVVGYKDAKPGSVTLIFNEDIEIADGDFDNFYHTNSKNTVDGNVTDADVDGKELTLSFSNRNLPEGTAYIYILKDSVRDLWENKNGKIVAEVQVVVDKTPPGIKKLEVKSETQIVITFDEKVDKDEAVDEDNYTILNKKGEEVKNIIYSINYTSGTKEDKVTIDFNEKLSGDHTIVIDGVEDESGNAAKITKDFTVDDSTPPDTSEFEATLYKAGAKGQLVRIDFKDKMATEGKYSVIDPEKYEICGYELADLDVEPEFKVINDGKSIEIKIASTVDDDDGKDLAPGGVGTVVIGRVADIAGNYTANYATVLALAGGTDVAIDKAEATAKDEVKVTFKDYFDKFDANDIVLTTDISSADAAKATAAKLNFAKVSTSMNSDGNTVVTFKLADGSKLNPIAQRDSNTKTVHVFVVAAKSTNKYGKGLTVDTSKVVSDKIKPTLIKDDADSSIYKYVALPVGSNAFTLEFTEEITVARSIYFAGDDLIVTANSKELKQGTDYDVEIIASGGKDVLMKFTLKTGGVFKALDPLESDKSFTINVKSNDKTNYIQDVSNNNKITDVSASGKITLNMKFK